MNDKECIAELEARAEAAEKLSVQLRGIIIEHEKSNVGIMESYDKIEADVARLRSYLIHIQEELECEKTAPYADDGYLNGLDFARALVDSALRPEQPRPPHPHYCQCCAGVRECRDTSCKRGYVFGCENAPRCDKQPAESK